MAADIFKKGSVEMLVLFLLCRGDAHGYQLVQDIRELSGEQLTVQEGSLYPVLYRLEDSHCITSTEVRVATKTGRSRPRVNYHIEEKGRERLLELREEYQTVHRGIQSIFESGDAKV